MTTLFGIPNCDTVKKARVWLSEHAIEYTFHDFKKQGVPAELAQRWIDSLGWAPLINRQGTTWRKLPPETQASVVDAASALALMQAQPSVIKRPVLLSGDRVNIGFKPEIYATLFGKTTA